MFEKESEERTKQYVSKHIEKYNCENTHLETDNYNVGLETGYEAGFQDGAEFGYNKAKEWHYPSKGELPVESREYLVIAESDHTLYTCLESYDPDDNEWSTCWKIIAWQHIDIPKEIYDKEA